MVLDINVETADVEMQQRFEMRTEVGIDDKNLLVDSIEVIQQVTESRNSDFKNFLLLNPSTCADVINRMYILRNEHVWKIEDGENKHLFKFISFHNHIK